MVETKTSLPPALRPHLPSGERWKSSRNFSMKYLVCPYGFVMPCPTVCSSVTGLSAEPYTVAEEEKTREGGREGGRERLVVPQNSSLSPSLPHH
jgi:hypothetical protein